MAVRKLANQPGQDGPRLTAIATAAITANPTAGKYPGGVGVKLDTDPNNCVVTGAGEIPIGIVRSNVAVGEKATIWCGLGHLGLVTLGDTVTVDADGTALVKCDAAGKAVPHTTSANVFGTVIKAGVVGDVVPMFFKLGRPVA